MFHVKLETFCACWWDFFFSGSNLWVSNTLEAKLFMASERLGEGWVKLLHDVEHSKISGDKSETALSKSQNLKSVGPWNYILCFSIKTLTKDFSRHKLVFSQFYNCKLLTFSQIFLLYRFYINPASI